MKLPRLTIRRLMIAVAVVAITVSAWAAWFDPVRRWQRTITDDQDGARRWEAIGEMLSGKAPVDDETALATLIGALRSESPRVRETAVAGLGQLGHRARPALSALLTALEDPRPHIRELAARQLMPILPPADPGREAAMPMLRRRLGDRSANVRLQAARVLSEFGSVDEAMPILIEALRRPDYLSQAETLWSLGLIGPRARDALGEVVALETRAGASVAPDFSRYLRVLAARTRYMLGDRDAGLISLRTLSASSDVELASEARKTLSSLSGGVQIEAK